jgi:RNA polymerase sigma-70 factor, ECF subfamily
MSLNQQQFTTWHNHYYGRLLNSMTAVVRDRAIAEDVTSTALAIAWRNLNRFRGESSLYTWVYRIAMNEAMRQTSRRKPVSLDALEFPIRELTESDSVSDTHEREAYPFRLKEALTAIPAIHREVLIDHFVLGHKVKHIARRRRIPVGTVLSRIFAAKKMLRRAWQNSPD